MYDAKHGKCFAPSALFVLSQETHLNSASKMQYLKSKKVDLSICSCSLKMLSYILGSYFCLWVLKCTKLNSLSRAEESENTAEKVHEVLSVKGRDHRWLPPEQSPEGVLHRNCWQQVSQSHDSEQN